MTLKKLLRVLITILVLALFGSAQASPVNLDIDSGLSKKTNVLLKFSPSTLFKNTSEKSIIIARSDKSEKSKKSDKSKKSAKSEKSKKSAKSKKSMKSEKSEKSEKSKKSNKGKMKGKNKGKGKKKGMDR